MLSRDRSHGTADGSRYVRLGQYAVVLAAVGLIVALAFSQLFTTFVIWDDEGYFLEAGRDLLSGKVLYDQVPAIYGPLTYFSTALLAGFRAANVTHDAFRWITLPVWIAIAGLLAGVVWRWTRRFAPSVATFLLVGFRLKGLAKAVGHPQLWIILSVGLLLWLGLDWASRSNKEQRHALLAGVVLGAIILFKINIGIFESVGYLLAVSLHLKGRPRMLACGLLSVAAAAAGVGVFLATPITSEKLFALAYLASLAGTIGISVGRPVERPTSTASLMWLGGALVACVCLGMGATLALGSTPGAIYSAYVTTPAQFALSSHNPFLDATRTRSLLISAIGLCAGVGVFFSRLTGEARSTWLGILKIAAGAGLLCAFFYNQRDALTGSLLFLWLLIVEVPPLSGPAYSNRLLLALLSPLFSLQLFPMAGEQVDWAALLPMVAAAVLLGDGMNCVARENGPAALSRWTGFGVRAIGTLVPVVMFVLIGQYALGGVRQWRSLQPLNLPGAHWLRLPADDSARLTTAVRALTQNCQTVLLMPSLYSFSLWSGIPPAEEGRTFLWTEEDKKNDLHGLRHRSQACVLVSQDVYVFWKKLAASTDRDELLLEIQHTMTPIHAREGVTLYRF
jgi:hypothetical protein